MRKLVLFLILMLCCLEIGAGNLDGRSGYWDEHRGLEPSKDMMGNRIIANSGNLAYVAYAVRDGQKEWLKCKLVLTADIDMSQYWWRPMENWQGSIDGQGHTIKGLYSYHEEKDYSGFAGYTEDYSNITIENVTFEKCYAQGAKHVGVVIGYIDDHSTVTFKNVKMRSCQISSARWVNAGGFVGYVEKPSKVSFTNCYSDVYTGYNTKVNVGGYIGHTEGSSGTRISFENCVSKIEGNGYFINDDPSNYRSGYIGYAESGGILRFNKSAAICSYPGQTRKQYGAFVGHFDGDDVEATNCYIDYDPILSNDSRYIWRVYNFAFGTDYPSHNMLLTHSSFHMITTAKEGMPNVASAYQANKISGKFGTDGKYMIPCAGDSGMVVRFSGVDSIASVYGGNISNGLYGGYAYMERYRPMTYKVLSSSERWVYADETEKMSSKERIGKWTFKGIPQDDGKINLRWLTRPQFVWQDTTFNTSRMHTKLKWTCKQSYEMEQYWSKKGGSYLVYRNGVRVDSIPCTATEWTDTKPLVGKLNSYKIVFVCPDLKFDESDNTDSLKWETTAIWDGTVPLKQSGSLGKVKLSVEMPNASMLDGCKLSFYKLVMAPGKSSTDDANEVVTEGKLLGVSEFHSAESSNSDFILLDCVDDEKSVPCSKWIYQVVCDGFTDKNYVGKKFLTNKVEFIDSNEISISQFTATKGESTDKIKVEWKTSGNKSNATVRYELSRMQYTNGINYDEAVMGDDGWKTVYTVDNATKTNVYTDNTLPGYVYIYRLRAYPSCDGSFQTSVYATASDIGYAASRGTIMGSITYGTGSTAVEGVDVKLTADENSLQNKSDVYSMSFGSSTDCLPLAPGLGDKFWQGDWTLSFLLRPNGNAELSRVATLPGKWALNIQNRDLSVGSVRATLPLVKDFNFVMLRHDAKAKKLYIGYTKQANQGEDEAVWSNPVDDSAAAKWLAYNTPADTVRRVADGTLVFGQATDKDIPFTGYLDEVRLWSRQLSNKEIANTYNRYLTGNELSLEAYYTFDAGVAEFAFDSSHPDGLWNNRNSRLPKVDSPALVSNVVPSADNLCYRGVTDKNGEYQIAGVPYMGEGTNYQVVPVFGTHEFKPSSTRRYVSAQSLAHTGVDFSDQSSFRVPVQAYYVYGNLPAEGLGVLVDGVIQNGNDNKPILTDADGKAVVNVPIGRHRLSLSASKHTLVNKGYPASITSVGEQGECVVRSLADRDGYIDFQADYTAAVTFYDSTFVRVVGRVAGGKDEESKPIGFGKSSANIGQTMLTVAPSLPKTYMVNNGDFDITPVDTIATISSRLVFPKKGTAVTITTDAKTGEFTALLPPIRWEVKSVVAVSDGVSDFPDMSKYVNTFNLDPVNENADTLWLDSVGIHDPTKVDSYKTFKYNAKQKYTLYNNPQMTLTNLDADEGYERMLGAKYAMVQYVDDQTKTAVNDSILLWKKDVPHDGSAASYSMGMPVFRTGNDYRMRINIFEHYYNRDTHETTDVPVRGAAITVYNRWSNKYLRTLSTGDYTLDSAFVDTVKVATAAGTVDYAFTAGVPNPTTGDFSLPMTVSYVVNGVSYSNNFTGYVMGAIERGGSNFVTSAPKKLIGVLFDPPGSTSSAFMETGTTMTAKLNISESATVTSETGVTIAAGTETATYNLGPANATKTIHVEESRTHDILPTAKVTEGWSHDFTKSYVLKERIATGSDDIHVGAMGDVYIGRNTNWVFCPSEYVMLKESPSASGKFAVTSESGRKYQLEKWVGVGKYEKDSTSFRLSQNEIVNIQIPDLMKNRNALTTFVDKLPDPSSVQPAKGKFLAFALKSVEKKEYWDNNDFVTIEPASSDDTESVEDMVTSFNSTIGQWQAIISGVEKYKYDMFKNKERKTFHSSFTNIDYGFIDNFSFDAGTQLSRNFTATESTTGVQTTGTDISVAHSFDMKLKVSGFEYVKTFTKAKTTIGGSVKRVGTDTETQSNTFGYTLSDNNLDDHFSVDVYMPGKVVDQKTNNVKTMFMPGPFLFRTVAGQSRVPYEKQQMSLYYTENGQHVPLDNGTVSMDLPYLKFEKRELFNVPSGTTASVKVTLANNSTCTSSSINYAYTLKCISSGDTRGLDVRLDGQPLSSGWNIVLPPGKKVERTITFKQSRLDVTDYDNLVFRLLLSNFTDANIDTISIHFTPQAPKMTMKSNSGFVINGDSKSQKMLFKLGGYSADYYGFTGVRMQYKLAGESTWHTQRILLNDKKRWTDFRGDLPDGWRQLNAEDTCSIDFSSLAEGTYQVRAESFSILSPSEELTDDTEPITIVKDTKAPVVLGAPSPSTGYFTRGSELSVTFNKTIDLTAVNDDNFYVTAELNDAEVTHRTGLHFDGNTPAHTQSRVNIFGNDATVAFWYKPQTGKKSCLFSQTLNPSVADSLPVKIFYNADATLSAQFGSDFVTSQRKAIGADGKAEQDWMYAIVSFNKDKRTLRVYNVSGTGNEAQSSFINMPVKGLANNADCNVPLYVGGSKSGDECYAEMEGLVVYDKMKSFEDALKDKSNKHTANLRGIFAYWPMDEGYGKVAKEKVHSRNLSLMGTDNWYIPVKNYALHTDGKSQYVLVNTSGCPIGATDDYVLEMMFRSAAKKQDGIATIFSNGWGAAESPEDSLALSRHMALSLDTNGSLVLTASGKTYEPMGKNYNDNQWHHLAFCVNRDGYATLLVDTVDISNNELIVGTDLGAFYNSQMALGALVYKPKAESAATVSQYFEGDIDEVRLWDAHKTLANVKNGIAERLRGNEPGLVAYYPFERTDLVANQEKTTPTLSDRAAANANTGFQPAADPTVVGYGDTADMEMLAEKATTDKGARLKAAGFESRLDIDWVVSETDRNKIVMSFPSALSKARIENCIVNFTVRDIMDEHGNRMAQPETWSVYVSQKSLNAYINEEVLTQQIGEMTDTKLTITNISTSNQTWQIGNLPAWLKASSTEGLLQPYSSATVTLTTDAAYGIGTYQDMLYISDSEGMQTPMSVTLNVTGNKPNWSVDVESDQWMAIMGRIKLDDTWCSDENSMVAAFDSKGKCHGIGMPEYDSNMDAYFVHLNVVGNMPKGDNSLTFKVWEAATGLTYSNVKFTERSLGEVNKLQFVDKKVLGSFSYPCVFKTDNVTHQVFNLKKGWNWVSLWVKPEEQNFKELFGKGKGIVTDVKRRYVTDEEQRPITTVDLNESYHVYASDNGELDIEGVIASPSEYEVDFPYNPDVEQTWTWIGYPVGAMMTLNEAFADFQPVENDIVKSQSEYAIYNGRVWVGTLKYLTPGNGYIYGYHGKENLSWHYPSKLSVGSDVLRAAAPRAVVSGVKRFGCDYHHYAANASVLAKLTLDGEEAKGCQLGAFVDGECRGWTTVDSTGVAYLTVSGDHAGSSIRYRMSDPETGAVTAVRGQDSYAENAVVGSLKAPRELRAVSAKHFSLDVVPSAYEDYTYLSCTVLDADASVFAHDYELAAFSESGECRGVCAGEAGKDAEMAIYGEQGERFTFRLWDKQTLEELPLMGTKEYDALTPCQTIKLRVGTDGINAIGADSDSKGNWYSTSGVRHNGKPSQTGVYIKNHRKTTVVRR